MTDVQPAPKQLAMLATAMRGWDYEEIRAAIIAASHAGWDDERIYRETFRLLLLRDGCPADLRNAARNADRPKPGKETFQAGLAAARQALEGHTGPVAREDGAA
jgi:hypothetical protein